MFWVSSRPEPLYSSTFFDPNVLPPFHIVDDEMNNIEFLIGVIDEALAVVNHGYPRSFAVVAGAPELPKQ
jgi:hypothetical protein